jgi:hypothetical protein
MMEVPFYCTQPHTLGIMHTVHMSTRVSCLQEKAVADDDCSSVLVKWTAEAACLGARMSVPATGRLSTISGMTFFEFDDEQRIKQLVTYRQPFKEEHLLFSAEVER